MEQLLPIIDLHCDLLCYLEKDDSRTPHDPQVRCSLPQLKQGNVKVQVMAVFADTGKESSVSGERQINILKSITTDIRLLLAIENASGLLDEEEPLERCFSRIDKLQETGYSPLYIGMTWNPENRFGGGASVAAGLKSDGRELLHYMSGRHIAIDLSHASDALAYDILNEIDRHSLDVPVMASHSNARAVFDVPRNLPDDLIKEVIAREGVVGINYVSRLLGEGREPLMARHVDHMLSLGAMNSLAIGSDFFYCNDWAAALKMNPDETFYLGYDTAACHQAALQMYRSALGLDAEQMKKIAYGNALRFIGERAEWTIEHNMSEKF